MAAKETLTIEVLTTQAQRNIDALNSKLGGLKTALAGLAIGAYVRNVINFADAIQDVVNVTGLANNVLIGFANTVAQNGGNFNMALDAATKFSRTLGEVAAGSNTAFASFRQLGFSLEELRNDDVNTILEKTLDRLGKLEKQNKALAASIKPDIFGKQFATVSTAGVSEAYKAAVKGAVDYARAQQEVAKLQDKIDQGLVKLQLSVLKALEPLAQKLGALPQEKVDQLIDSFVKLAETAVKLVAIFKTFTTVASIFAAIGGYFVLAKAGAASLGKTIDVLGTQSRGFGKAWAAATTVFEKFKAVAFTVFTFLTKRLPYILGGLLRFVPIIGAVVTALYAANEVIKLVFDVDVIQKFIDFVKDAALTVGDFFGLVDKQAVKAKQEAERLAAEMAKIKEKEKKDAEDAAAEQLKRDQEQAARAEERLAKLEEFKNSLKQTVDAAKDQTDEFINQLKFQDQLLGLSDDQKEIEQAKADALKSTSDAIKKLQGDQQALKDATGQWIDALGPEKYQEIGRAIDELKVKQQGLPETVQEYIQKQQAAKKAIDEAAHAVEMFAEKQKFTEAGIQLTENLSLIGLYGDELEKQTAQIELQRQLRQIQYDTDVKLFELEKQKTQLGEENFEREKRQILELAELRKQTATANANTQAQTTAAQKEQQTDFIYGWNSALDEYIKNTKNKAEQAKQLFTTFTKGIEDAFVNFAKTGKLSFRDLINSMVEQILRSQIQNLIASIFTPLTGGGGTFGTILKSIFGGGRANGGPVDNNKSYLIGEKGPELFVPKTAGTVVPNDMLGGGGGKQVINNYITNQISALDSKSVAQLFAENRKTLLGTVQMAQRELP
jgi:lambda family phage tail tape measure protein